MTKHISKYVGIFCLLFVLFPAPLRAVTLCECTEPKSFEEELDAAQMVFSGVVKDVFWQGGRYDRVTFEIDRAWKGTHQEEVEILTDHPHYLNALADTLDCAIEFEEGQEYLVYTYTNKNSPPLVSHCGRTQLLSDAKDELERLGAPIYTSEIE